MRRLAASVAVLLGLDAIFQHVAACAQTWQVGAYVPVSGEHFPAYLTIQDLPDGVYAVAVRLAGIAARPFLLFVSTQMMIDLAISELLGRNKSRAIALADVFAVDERGQWAAQRPPAELFREFRVGCIRGRSSSSTTGTISDASWSALGGGVRSASSRSIRCTSGFAERPAPTSTRRWAWRADATTSRRSSGSSCSCSPNIAASSPGSHFGADRKNEHRRLLLAQAAPRVLRHRRGSVRQAAGRAGLAYTIYGDSRRLTRPKFRDPRQRKIQKIWAAEPERAQGVRASRSALSGPLSRASREISPVARDRAPRPPRQRRRNSWTLPTATTAFTHVPFSSSATMPGNSPGAVRCPVWSSKTMSRT